MSYEAIIGGWHHVMNPAESGGMRNLIINLSVLGIGIILECIVLYKAGKEILHEAGIDKGGIAPITLGFRHLNRAKPATKLVFMEDFVATARRTSRIYRCLVGSFPWITCSGRHCIHYDWINDVLRSW